MDRAKSRMAINAIRLFAKVKMKTIASLLPRIKGLIIDMDGVLWKDSQPLVDLPEVFATIQSLGLKLTLATNNATRTIYQYREKLASFGVALDSSQIINSVQAAGYYLQHNHPGGGKVYVVGENSLKETLAEFGYLASEDESDIVAVVAGLDRTLTYEKLRQATLLIRKGVPFIGTNPDRTFPTPLGLVPGAGAVLAAIETATDVKPIIVGKPAPTLYRLAMERMETSPQETLVVGDRLDTDIAGGQELGCLTALVLSGISTHAEALAWNPLIDIITPNLRTLMG
jgi:4-nitrophenyl phosphatase